MTTRLLAGASALTLALLLAASQANATEVKFASFSPNGSAPNFTWTSDGTTGGAMSGTGSSFLNFLTAGNFSQLPATITYSGVTPADPINGGAYSFGDQFQQAVSGSVSFTFAGPTGTYGGVALTNGENLLTATFTNALMQGGGSLGVVISDIPDLSTTLVYTSSVLTIPASPTVSEFSITLGGAAPAISSTADGVSIANFSAVSTGSFYNDPNPTIPAPLPPGPVPEPAAWAMMLVGFGLVGGLARRRQGARAAA